MVGHREIHDAVLEQWLDILRESFGKSAEKLPLDIFKRENWTVVQQSRELDPFGAKGAIDTIDAVYHDNFRELSAKIEYDPNVCTCGGSTLEMITQRLSVNGMQETSRQTFQLEGADMTTEICRTKIVDFLLQKNSHQDWVEAGYGHAMVEKNWKRAGKKITDGVTVRYFELSGGKSIIPVSMLVTELRGIYSVAVHGDDQPLNFCQMIAIRANPIERDEDFGSWS